MPIYRVRKNRSHPYTIVDNTSINDKRLSAKAKGILIYLISKPDNWYTNLPNLVSAFTDSTRSIRAGIVELISLGYIVRTHVRKDDGRFTHYDYSIYEIPLKPTLAKTMAQPECRFATLDNATLDNITLLNTDKKEITEKSNNNISNNSSSLNKPADVPLWSNEKKEAIRILNELKIFNCTKLFDLFDLPIILEYANWLKERKTKIHNPTGFLITAIKEKWITLEPDEDKPGLMIFHAQCSICHNTFSYEEFVEKYTECIKCRKKG